MYINSNLFFLKIRINDQVVFSLPMLQYFLEGLSNHTGYPVFKLIRKNIWQVYDALTSQVFIKNKTHVFGFKCLGYC